MEYLFIGIGGAAGSLARFIIGKAIAVKLKRRFPWNTFIINITGAVFLGLVLNLNISGNVYFLIADGFLGAFTTFSTFMYEGTNLIRENEIKNAAMYIFASLCTGIIGFIMGMAAGSLINQL
jgi:fluoride exporter